MTVDGLLGSLDQQAIQDGMTSGLDRAASCFESRSRRQPYLGGTIKLQFRISTAGKIKRLQLVESTLGAWEVERCVVDGMRSLVFARPRGGEAEFTYPINFPARMACQQWDPGMVQDELIGNRDVILGRAPPASTKVKPRRKRRRRARSLPPPPPAVPPLQAPDGLIITFYVDGAGKVVSAGMTAEAEVAPEFAERFETNLKQVKFVGAHSRYAKVSYRW